MKQVQAQDRVAIARALQVHGAAQLYSIQGLRCNSRQIRVLMIQVWGQDRAANVHALQMHCAAGWSCSAGQLRFEDATRVEF